MTENTKKFSLATVATIIGTIIAAIALIPAFGQWLSPSEPLPPTTQEQITTAIATTSLLTPNNLVTPTQEQVTQPIQTISSKQPLGVSFEEVKDLDDLSAEEIFLVYQDGSRLYLTNNSYMDRGGSFSPDNKLISFSRRIDRNEDGKIFWDDNADLYIMNSDGSNVIQVTDNFCDTGWGTWSPDGKYIAFSCEQSEMPDILFVYELSSGSTTPIYTDERVSAEAWSPDGKYIAFYNSQHCVAIVRPNGSGYQVISDYVGSGGGLFWTVDGKIITPFQDKGYLLYNLYDGTSVLMSKTEDHEQRIYQQMYNWSSLINLSNP